MQFASLLISTKRQLTSLYLLIYAGISSFEQSFHRGLRRKVQKVTYLRVALCNATPIFFSDEALFGVFILIKFGE